MLYGTRRLPKGIVHDTFCVRKTFLGYGQAEEMAERAIQRDEGSVHSHFLLFKVSILLGKEEKGALEIIIAATK